MKTIFTKFGFGWLLFLFIFLQISSEAKAEFNKKLSVLPLTNPVGWEPPYDPGLMLAEWLRKSLETQGRFQMVPSLSQAHKFESPGVTMEKEGRNEAQMIPKKSMKITKQRRMQPVQILVQGSVLTFDPGKVPKPFELRKQFRVPFVQKAVLEIELNLISNHTRRTIAQKKFKSVSTGGLVLFEAGPGSGNLDAPEFKESSMGLAFSSMGKEIVSFINARLKQFPLEGEVIRVLEEIDELLLNVGEVNGVRVGDLFSVYSVELMVQDPFTYVDLGDRFQRRGVVKIKDVQEKLSRAAILAGTGFQAGDFMRSRKVDDVYFDGFALEKK